MSGFVACGRSADLLVTVDENGGSINDRGSRASRAFLAPEMRGREGRANRKMGIQETSE